MQNDKYGNIQKGNDVMLQGEVVRHCAKFPTLAFQSCVKVICKMDKIFN